MTHSKQSLIDFKEKLVDEERWLPVKGWEGWYEVSDMGRVRSLDRIVTCSLGKKYPFKGRVLSLTPDHSGYLIAHLKRNGKSKYIKAHRLVAQNFLQGPEKPQVNHKNLIKADNRLENLEWATRRENHQHALSMGILYAANNPRRARKLTPDIVRAIRAERAAGDSLPKLAKRYSINTATVHAIHKKTIWRDLPDSPVAHVTKLIEEAE